MMTPGLGFSLTGSGDSVSSGWNFGLQVAAPAGPTAQWGVDSTGAPFTRVWALYAGRFVDRVLRI